PMNTNIYSLVDCLIARLLGKKIIYEYYISRYDTNVKDKKLYKSKNYKAKYDLFLDKSLTKLATKIICLNNAEYDYYKDFMCDSSNSKLEIIPLVIDLTESFPKNEVDISIVKYCWWGTYLPLHGLDKIIKAFYKSNNQNSLLYIFGDSDEKAKEYIELVSELGLENKVFFNHSYTFNNKKLPDFLVDNFVVALGNFGDSAKAKTVLVNKIVDAASLSLPILTSESKASSYYFDNNVSIIYSERNIDNIANKMNEINSGSY
ncbi:glycosyltransferase, partial [Photobacterium phosphoreum]